MMTPGEGPARSLAEFLFPTPAPRDAWKIFAWWERRRLFYNLAVGAAGLLSVGVVSAVVTIVTGSFGLPPWQPIVAFGVMANVCYLLGSCIEVLVHAVWGRSVLPVGPALYRIGLTFSVGLALFPTLLAILMAVASVVFNLLG